jgi:imidazolonepropionase-like amidohydrolase
MPRVQAAEQKKVVQPQVLITNVNVWDGTSDGLIKGVDVLVEGNKIKKIGKIKAHKAVVIDGKGGTLMPGLIESHSHLSVTASLGKLKHHMTWEDIAIRTGKMAETWLMDGFTTVRDVGGPVAGTKRAIDAGVIPGPRIYPSNAFISQTSGHGDLRELNDRHSFLDGTSDEYLARLGFYHMVDGRDAVLAATRENLRTGATQIKVMAGGGNGSEFDPIDSKQFLPDELKAVVQAAADWDTYVTAHLFYPDQINRALDAGIKCLEHLPAIDEATMQRVVRENIFVMLQMNGISKELRDSPFNQPYARAGIIAIQNDAKNFVALVKKYKPKMVFGTDALGDFDTQAKQRRYELWERARLFGNLETLRQATSVAGELALLTGKRNPYKEGKLGVVEEGAYADLLIVDGNPLKDIKVLGASEIWIKAPDPQPIETIKVIMKDGKIYKNTL